MMAAVGVALTLWVRARSRAGGGQQRGQCAFARRATATMMGADEV